MVLVVVRADDPPVDVQTLSIYQGDKLQERQFRIGSKLEHYFFRVRHLDGTIMRYETPDYYFQPIMRDILVKANRAKTPQRWGEDDGPDDVTLLNAAQKIRSRNFAADAKTAETLYALLANYDRSLNLWKFRRSTQGDLAVADYTEGYVSDPSESESDMR